MTQAIDFSHFLSMITSQQAEAFKDFICSFNISIEFPNDIYKSEYLNAMLIDKKNSNNQLKFILISDIGKLKLITKSKSDLENFLELKFN